jgi:hypothetical protein
MLGCAIGASPFAGRTLLARRGRVDLGVELPWPTRLMVIALAVYSAASLCGSAAVILLWRRVAAAAILKIEGRTESGRVRIANAAVDRMRRVEVVGAISKRGHLAGGETRQRTACSGRTSSWSGILAVGSGKHNQCRSQEQCPNREQQSYPCVHE